MLNLTQCQRVEYNIPDTIQGIGKVVGIATNGGPLLGRSIIIEPEQSISSEVYPFSHFVCFESYLKLIK